MKFRPELSALLFFVLTSVCLPQKSGGGWIKIGETPAKRIWIDTKGLSAADSTEIKVWAVESFNSPQSVDSAFNNISKIKTLYRFDKSGRRYSINEIIYYDTGNTVIKDFKYPDDPADAGSRYNYPLFAGSEIFNIFEKSLGIIVNGKTK